MQALNISFVVSSSILIISLGGLGHIGNQTLLLSVGAIVPVTIAVKYGSVLRRHVSEKQFKVGVLIVLFFLGVNLVTFT